MPTTRSCQLSARQLRRTLLVVVALVGAGPMSESSLAQQTIPPQWHQKLTDREKAWTSQVVNALRAVPDFPHLAAPVHIKYGEREPLRQINAFEEDRQITVPVEMLRFLESDPSAFAFLLAHEAGHAKQEEKYGQSCYAAGNVEFSKFDWFRTLADVAGATVKGLKDGGAREGAGGALNALGAAQKQACEDNADAWGIHFLRQTRGADLNGAIRMFNKLTEFRWQSLTEQFTSDHSIDVVRIGHVLALIQQDR